MPWAVRRESSSGSPSSRATTARVPAGSSASVPALIGSRRPKSFLKNRNAMLPSSSGIVYPHRGQ